jgi:VCBS repeat-containing protein
MATTCSTPSTGITTTSMFNTPQAVDDLYFISEDNATLTYYFDVMSNDLGGNAKTLWSITDGPEYINGVLALDAAEIADLISKDAVNVYESSEKGAQVAIVNGKIAYNASSISGLVNSLAAGETLTDTITYAIRLGNGTLSLATMSVKITGKMPQRQTSQLPALSHSMTLT